MTPLGILLGLTLFSSAGGLLSNCMNAISAGTFIYIALVEIILSEFEQAGQSQKDKYIKFGLVCTGIFLMSLLSSSDHHH